jgi:hypothetical protein
MAYNILHYQGQLVGVTPFEWVSLPGVSVEIIEGKVPDLNKVYWDSESFSLVPISNTVITKLEFLSRFTIAERTAIRNSTDPIIVDMMELLNASTEVDLTDSRTISIINHLSSVGIVSSNRVQELLT